MHRVIFDQLKTPDSCEWRHRGYVVRRNPTATGINLRNSHFQAINYFVYRPKASDVFAATETLDDARMAIEGDRNTAEGRHE